MEERIEIRKIKNFNKINRKFRITIDKPWFNEKIRLAIKERRRINRLRRNAKVPEEEEHLTLEYNKQRSKVKHLIREAIELHEIKISDEVKKYVDENILFNEEGKILDSGEIKEKRIKTNLDMEERRAEIEGIELSRINSNKVKINKPWFNEDIRVEITKRNRIKRWRDKSKIPEEEEYLKYEYNKQQHKIRHLVREAIEQYEIEISDDIKTFVEKDTKLSKNIDKLREREKKEVERILYNEEGKVFGSREIKKKRMMVQHGVNPISKTQSKSEKKKQKKKKKEEAHESDDGGEELDLSKELFPLSHYVGDPVDLINQIFCTITGPKIAAMLPPILKGTDLGDLKNDCIHELSGMSKKRILCVINGQEMEGSSGSEEDEDEDDLVMSSPVKGTSPRGSVKRPIPSKEAAAAALLKKIKQEPVSDDEVQERDPVTGKSVMELLELEMRARIIKTMLDKGGDKAVLTEEMVSKVISGGKTDSKVKSPVKESHTEKRRSMEDKENAHIIDDDDDVQIVDSPDEKRSDRRHRRRRRRHGSRSSKHDRTGSNRRRSRSERGDERGSRSEKGEERVPRGEERALRGEERGSRNKHKSSEISREDEEADKKKKKPTRKEFEERMKRAKMNRKYRKRGVGSEEEVNEEGKDGESNIKENENGESSKKEKETADAKEEGEEDGAVAEASEKEEGEWDSNEEEEGQCSDTGSSSFYSDFSDEGNNQGTHRRKSGSRSRSKSDSPHRSPSHEQKSSRRAPRVPIKTVPSGTVRMPNDDKEKKSVNLRTESKISSTQTKTKEEEEENWGQKCDIEFVDSEEDFDGENNGTKVPKKLGISFALKKKVVPSINQKDIDDLPMKKINRFDDLPDEDLPMKKRNLVDDVPEKNDDKDNDDQILILSDIEVEDKESLDKDNKNILKCKDVSKETEENNAETITANSLIIIPDDSNPAVESKSDNKKNTTNDKASESISVPEVTINKENIASEETLENNTVSEAKEKNVNIASKEASLNISASEDKENNEVDKKTDELCIEELDRKKPIDKEELESHIKSDKEEIKITEDTNVHKVTDITAKECNKEIIVGCDKKKKVDSESTEPIIIPDDKDEDIEDNREIISGDVVKKSDDIKVKLTVGKSKTKKVAADKIINDDPPPRTTRRSTRASKKEELEQKSNETVENSNIKKAKKKQKERKLAIENEKRILDFENEFEEPRDTESSEDNKAKTITKGEEIISQTGDNRDSREITGEQGHEIPEEENLQIKTTNMVKDTENVEKCDKLKDCEESFKGFGSRNVCLEPQVTNSESLKSSLRDGQVAARSSVEDVYHPEGYSKMQLVAALDLTISKNKGASQSNQGLPNAARELSAFYHPDTSGSNSVQDYSLNTPRTHDMDDEEEIDVVGGVDDEEIDVVGVDDDKVASMADDNATTTGMEQFAAAQGYTTTGLELHSEIKMLKVQNVDGDDISNIDNKSLSDKSKRSEDSPGDFYRGMDELGYSDDEKVQDEVDIEKLRNSHVEPIRIETGLIRKKVPAKQKKDEVKYPDQSWSKDKKKKEKNKDTLVYESLGSLCSVLPRENAPKNELLEESSQTSEVARKDYNSDDECSRDSSKCLSETSKILPEDESESRSSTQSKGANKEMEIIGEIEPSTAGNDDIDDGRSSWSMRWLQSEKVQKVVSSSKMLSRVRKNIQQKDKATKVTAAKQNETEQEKPKPKEQSASNAVIGSIEEYERLFGKKTNIEGQTEGNNSQATSATVTPTTIATETTEPSPASFPESTSASAVAKQQSATQHSASKVPIIDSDSEGDSEEEALWSKIMGK